MKIRPHGEIPGADFRKLLIIASHLAFQYSENGQDACQITRRAFIEMLREGFHERRKSFGPQLDKPPRAD